MGLRVNVRSEGVATVVVLRGAACDDLLGRVAEGIGAVASDRPLVLDLTDVILSHPPDVSTFLAELGRRCPELRVVCARLSGRRLIRRCAPATGVTTFASIDEALGGPAQPAPGALGAAG